MTNILRPGFVYDVEHLDREGRTLSTERVHNIMPVAAVNYILAAALTGGTATRVWRLGLFGADRQPLATDTATSFLAEADEIDAYANDGRRQELELSAVTDGATSTLARPNIFDFTARGVVQGAFIVSSADIGSTSGLLLSAAFFSAPKTIEAGESLRVPCGFALTSA